MPAPLADAAYDLIFGIDNAKLIRARVRERASGPLLLQDTFSPPVPPASAALQHVELSFHERLFRAVKCAHGLLVSRSNLQRAVRSTPCTLVQVPVLYGAVCERCYARWKGLVVLPFRRVAHPAPLPPRFGEKRLCSPFLLRPPLFQGLHASRGWPAGRVRLPRVPHDRAAVYVPQRQQSSQRFDDSC